MLTPNSITLSMHQFYSQNRSLLDTLNALNLLIGHRFIEDPMGNCWMSFREEQEALKQILYQSLIEAGFWALEQGDSIAVVFRLQGSLVVMASRLQLVFSRKIEQQNRIVRDDEISSYFVHPCCQGA